MRARVLFGWAMFLVLLATAAGEARAEAAISPVSIKLGARNAKGVPVRVGCTRLGGGNIDVTQPTADTLIITMSGVAVAYPHPCGGSEASFTFDLEQCFQISFDDPKKVKSAKLSIQGRVIGLLRSHCKKGGSARVGDATASVCCGETNVVTLSMHGTAVADGENLSINNREGPVIVPVAPADYVLHQTFAISATHEKGICGKAASAEFAPDPALDPLWVSHKEPFHGATKKDFGFQIIIQVVAE